MYRIIYTPHKYSQTLIASSCQRQFFLSHRVDGENTLSVTTLIFPVGLFLFFRCGAAINQISVVPTPYLCPTFDAFPLELGKR
jgi:hypothetical protein